MMRIFHRRTIFRIVFKIDCVLLSVVLHHGDADANRSNAFEVSNNGHSIVYDNNGSGSAAIRGARYIDNTCIAWGYVSAGGGASPNSFGILGPVTKAGNAYTITLNYVDNSGNQVQMSGSAVVATPLYGGDPCITITAEPVTWTGTVNQCVIRTWSSCAATSHEFMFHVFGR